MNRQTAINWQVVHFDALSNHMLYALLRLRSEVFVVEQQCIFLDMDNIDQHCFHVLGFAGSELAAATRLVPSGKAYAGYPSIGRVVTAPRYRNSGLGRQLMEHSIAACRQHFGMGPIKIGAQLYLRRFYESLGFVPCGPVYDEDGIDHIPMLLQAGS